MKKLMFLLLPLFAIGCSSGVVKEEPVVKKASLCDCVNMDQDNMTDECKTMKDEWKVKFGKASEEEKETMQADIVACEEAKEELEH